MTISVSMKMTPKQAGQLYMEHSQALAKIQELEDKLNMAYARHIAIEPINSIGTCNGYSRWLENLGAFLAEGDSE
jgi:hypothetical protein